MEWRPFSDLLVGGKVVSVKSLSIPNEDGHWKRYRVFSLNKKPAWARLFKDKYGRIGVLVTGSYNELFKIGRFPHLQSFLLVPLNAIAKKARIKLLKQMSCELYEEDGILLARERNITSSD